MKFATIPCCCNNCACATNLSSDNPAWVTVAGSTIGGTTNSLEGAVSYTDECLLEVSRRIRWQVKNFMISGVAGTPIGSVITWIYSGNGTADLKFRLTKNASTNCIVDILLGNTVLASQLRNVSEAPNGAGAQKFYAHGYDVDNGVAYFAPSGITLHPMEFGAAGVVFIPGDTVTFEWDLNGSGQLFGVKIAGITLGHPQCPTLFA